MPIIWYSVGAIALLFGMIGVILPVMPTVPFLLVATWAFARSSPALKNKIVNHSVYGPPIKAWQEHGAIGRFAKIWAVSAMSAGVIFSYFAGLPDWVVAMQALICFAIGIYIVTRPTH